MTDDDPNFKGFNTGEIPAWLKKPPKSQRVPWTPPPKQTAAIASASTPVQQIVERETVRTIVEASKPSSKATAGILIIATLMAASFWYGFALVLSLIVNPPTIQTISGIEVYTGEVWTFGRSLFCLIVAGVLTWLTWWVALAVAED